MVILCERDNCIDFGLIKHEYGHYHVIRKEVQVMKGTYKSVTGL